MMLNMCYIVWQIRMKVLFLAFWLMDGLYIEIKVSGYLDYSVSEKVLVAPVSIFMSSSITSKGSTE